MFFTPHNPQTRCTAPTPLIHAQHPSTQTWRPQPSGRTNKDNRQGRTRRHNTTQHCFFRIYRSRSARTEVVCGQNKKKCLHFSICACHPCAGAMLIFSVSFQFYRMIPGGNPNSNATQHTPTHPLSHIHPKQHRQHDQRHT